MKKSKLLRELARKYGILDPSPIEIAQLRNYMDEQRRMKLTAKDCEKIKNYNKRKYEFN